MAGHNVLTFNTFYTICDLLFLDSKPLKSLLNQESTFRALCEMLNTKVANLGDYKDVAQFYGFDFYQIMSVKENQHEPEHWLSHLHVLIQT